MDTSLLSRIQSMETQEDIYNIMNNIYEWLRELEIQEEEIMKIKLENHQLINENQQLIEANTRLNNNYKKYLEYANKILNL